MKRPVEVSTNIDGSPDECDRAGDEDESEAQTDGGIDFRSPTGNEIVAKNQTADEL